MTTQKFDDIEEYIPFVPALDLLEAREKVLPPEKVAAIASALFMSLPTDQGESLWASGARLRSIERGRL